MSERIVVEITAAGVERVSGSLSDAPLLTMLQPLIQRLNKQIQRAAKRSANAAR